MVEFIVHKEEKKKTVKKNGGSAGTSFWLPFAIVLAGAMVSGAVLFKDQIIGRPSNDLSKAAEDVSILGATGTPTPTQAVAVDLAANLTGAPMLGEVSASVTLVEFSDFQCPACEQFFTMTQPQIKKDYVETGKVKYYFKNFPLTNIHPNATPAAEAALCANEQGKFWEYHDQLFAKQDDWAGVADPTAKFESYAKVVGLKTNSFNDCLTSGEGRNKSKVEEDLQLGVQIGVSGTPTVYVNGILAGRPGYIPSFSDIKTLIEAALKK